MITVASPVPLGGLFGTLVLGSPKLEGTQDAACIWALLRFHFPF